MSDPRTLALRLLALAVGANTPEEEARTAAMGLARLIAKHALLGPPARSGRAAEAPTPEPAPPPPPRRQAPKPERASWPSGYETIPSEATFWEFLFCDVGFPPPPGVRFRSDPAGPPPAPKPSPPPPKPRTPDPDEASKKKYREGWDRVWGDDGEPKSDMPVRRVRVIDSRGTAVRMFSWPSVDAPMMDDLFFREGETYRVLYVTHTPAGFDVTAVIDHPEATRSRSESEPVRRFIVANPAGNGRDMYMEWPYSMRPDRGQTVRMNDRDFRILIVRDTARGFDVIAEPIG